MPKKRGKQTTKKSLSIPKVVVRDLKPRKSVIGGSVMYRHPGYYPGQ